MNISNYEDLTNFLYGEIDKRNEFLGVATPSKSFLSSTENELHRYAKLYYKPLFARAKRQVKLQKAIDTMPHGKVWQFFHAKRWAQIQEMLAVEKAEKKKVQEQKPVSTVLYPEVLHKQDVPTIQDSGGAGVKE